jgi:predicted O-methyltransferase YrrM
VSDKWTAPYYPSLFPHSGVAAFGMGKTVELQQEMLGGIGLTPEDVGVLAQAIVNAGHGDYLELGTLYGGSACLVGHVKEAYGIGGKIFCLDNFHFNPDSYSMAVRNIEEFGIPSRTTIRVGDTVDVEEVFCGQSFNCILIDASHDYASAFKDFLNVASMATKYIVFHDYDAEHLGVVKAVQDAITYGAIPVHVAHHTAVLEVPHHE